MPPVATATATRLPRPTFSLKLSDFCYDYPKDLIARYPAEPRDSARLLVLDRATRSIEHRTFRDIVEYFDQGDVLVVNDSKVFPARLYGNKEKTGARVETFLLRELNSESRLWDVIVDPARKIRVGNKLYFSDDLVAEVVDNTTSRGRTIRFIFDGTREELHALIDRHGQTPLPPYLRREAEPEDRERYQTVFARKRGAVAAPTAGLHFTPELVARLLEKGVDLAPVTLHVGLGTFNPVEVEDLTKHRMDSENYTVSPETCEVVNRALRSPTQRVTVCGTTCVRAVESCLSATGDLKPGEGWTDRFIYPPYTFRITERLLTNFHMPRSTLLMLVSAFADRELVMHAYEEAVRERYRLFSFGDAMLIL
jgi:S-adenosylmethionine:tRNA ribosyltransferase-isomerase